MLTDDILVTTDNGGWGKSGVKLSSFLVELKLLGVRSETDVDLLAAKYLSFPENLLTLTSHCGFFMMKCFKNLDVFYTSFLEKLRGYPWVKTSTGLSYPPVSILHEPTWGYLLNITDVPWIDENFYGNNIRLYKVDIRRLMSNIISKEILVYPWDVCDI
ncbi:hypothetical protein RND81_07G015600 [Saponaria officinalis]|uniref:Uncharacterized protein n=1 Tax=Saponaria officinalis TaxID=3572 RepID=A0AAW1JMN7_SAPOF